MTTFLTTAAACARWHVSRGKLAQMRRDGLIQAVNINPNGERAVWRYAGRLEVVDGMEDEMRWQKVKRGFGL